MTVRRLIALLVALAFAMALGFPPGPTQAASYADMPCHADGTPAQADDGTTAQAGPSCCLPLCWVAVEVGAALSGEPLLPAFVSSVATSFASVSNRPHVPPPKQS